ncbi:YeeE/YedE family protein [Octadecabacter ascidiaceicola]|uniref:Putative inner membrane protein n=1 Tax=Octadecabacter ascidiaceicola TaxID=1655543 RepID=A0A238JMC7_9RHOB|nr:YeeE/YedE family protein [Octadecabacter ascidiaceicola]SMX30926.1 putative inner membrane protein [Octadecabacter ascidiaceicola]
MLDAWGDGTVAALGGAFGGILLGLAARLGRFCTLGAIEDYAFGRSDVRLRMWVLAIGTAVFGTFACLAFGLVTPTSSFYLNQNVAPIATILGSLVFGYGMAMAGNCGFGALARLGGGDLRSFVIVVVMGMAAYATISGPVAWLRVAAFPPPAPALEPQGIAHFTNGFTGLPVWVVGTAIGLGLIALALSSASMRSDKRAMFWSAVVGMAVISAWVSTSWIAANGFDGTPVVSHTFSAPIGETMLYGMTASGQTLSFGIGSVAGVWLGAFIGSLIKGHFRWEACEDPRELRRQIFGAAMMGAGAAVALGCSIGQGLSAFSLLAFSAPLAFASMFIGARIGLRHLIEGFVPAE